LEDVERQAIEVRKNMARLREARQAREAVDAALRSTLPVPKLKKRTRKLAR